MGYQIKYRSLKIVIDEEERKLNYLPFGVSALEEHKEGHSWNTTVS